MQKSSCLDKLDRNKVGAQKEAEEGRILKKKKAGAAADGFRKQWQLEVWNLGGQSECPSNAVADSLLYDDGMTGA